MKCASINQPGPPEQLVYGDLPTPDLQPTQVLVRIGAASINPIDTYLRSGMIAMPTSFPFIPGCDLAGTVEQVGNAVTRFRVGDRVWGSNQGLFNRQGTLAEFAAVEEDWLYPTPAKMTDRQAAAGSLTGITAQLGLFQHAHLKTGEVVFVNGGTGGVGSMVIQFVKAAGGKVIATAGSEERRKLCRELGADMVLDYRSPKLDEELRAAVADHGGLDIWWETQREPDLTRTIEFMKKRGRIVLMAGRDAQPQFKLGPFYTNDLKICGFAIFNSTPYEQRVCAERMNEWFIAGKWEPLIGAEFPLSQAAQAHRAQEEKTLKGQGSLIGKIVVVPDSVK